MAGRDLSDDLSLLLDEARLPVPYVVVGNSFGGDLAMEFAAEHPTHVGGVVLLDVPPPDPNMTEEEIGGSWRDNADFLDALSMEHGLAAHPPRIGSIPLRAVIAEDGQTTEEDQSFWLRLSRNSTSVTIPGDHGLFYSNPAGVIEQVALLEQSIPGA